MDWFIWLPVLDVQYLQTYMYISSDKDYFKLLQKDTSWSQEEYRKIIYIYLYIRIPIERYISAEYLSSCQSFYFIFFWISWLVDLWCQSSVSGWSWSHGTRRTRLSTLILFINAWRSVDATSPSWLHLWCNFTHQSQSWTRSWVKHITRRTQRWGVLVNESSPCHYLDS